jgi:hypothetical protein
MKETMKFEFYAEVDPKTGPAPDTVGASRRHLKGHGAARFTHNLDTGMTQLCVSTCIDGDSYAATLHYGEDALRELLAEGASVLQYLETQRRSAMKPVPRKKPPAPAAKLVLKNNVVPLRRGPT